MHHTMIEISKLRLDGGTQPRVRMNEEVIDDYAEAMVEDLREFDAVDVFFDGEHYWLADGFHRIAAARKAGIEEFQAKLREGTQRDAVLHSLKANRKHGLRRSNEDKRAAVHRLFEDEEWSQWSDREIARELGVSQPFVSKIRAELSENGFQIASRQVQRGGTTYTMQTENIAAANAERAAAPTPQPADPSDESQEHWLYRYLDHVKESWPDPVFMQVGKSGQVWVALGDSARTVADKIRGEVTELNYLGQWFAAIRLWIDETREMKLRATVGNFAAYLEPDPELKHIADTQIAASDWNQGEDAAESAPRRLGAPIPGLPLKTPLFYVWAKAKAQHEGKVIVLPASSAGHFYLTFADDATRIARALGVQALNIQHSPMNPVLKLRARENGWNEIRRGLEALGIGATALMLGDARIAQELRSVANSLRGYEAKPQAAPTSEPEIAEQFARNTREGLDAELPLDVALTAAEEWLPELIALFERAAEDEIEPERKNRAAFFKKNLDHVAHLFLQKIAKDRERPVKLAEIRARLDETEDVVALSRLLGEAMQLKMGEAALDGQIAEIEADISDRMRLLKLGAQGESHPPEPPAQAPPLRQSRLNLGMDIGSHRVMATGPHAVTGSEPCYVCSVRVKTEAGGWSFVEKQEFATSPEAQVWYSETTDRLERDGGTIAAD